MGGSFLPQRKLSLTELMRREEPVGGAPLEALSSPLQQVGACRYNTGRTYTGEERADHRRRLHAGGAGLRATGHIRRGGEPNRGIYDCTPAAPGFEQRGIYGVVNPPLAFSFVPCESRGHPRFCNGLRATDATYGVRSSLILSEGTQYHIASLAYVALAELPPGQLLVLDSVMFCKSSVCANLGFFFFFFFFLGGV
jgi:hypothetical protein